MRKNRSQTKQRRSHHGLSVPALSTCVHCGSLHRPHHMCLACGYYNGRQVMDLEAKAQARAARIKAKQDLINAENAQANTDEGVTPSESATQDSSTDAKKD